MRNLKERAALAAGLLLLLLAGCAGPAEAETAEDGAAAPETAETGGVRPGGVPPAPVEAEDETDEAVVLRVYGGWDDAADAAEADSLYPLEGAEAQTITDLFYHHELEILDSPTDDAAAFAFEIGEDHLNTSMENLGTLTGRIGGELVLIQLGDSEREAVSRIVSPYVPRCGSVFTDLIPRPDAIRYHRGGTVVAVEDPPAIDAMFAEVQDGLQSVDDMAGVDYEKRELEATMETGEVLELVYETPVCFAWAMEGLGAPIQCRFTAVRLILDGGDGIGRRGEVFCGTETPPVLGTFTVSGALEAQLDALRDGAA